MRFLNTCSLQFEEFSRPPAQYAVLSHTWQEEEVLYQDMLDGAAQSKKGWHKLRDCCQKALEDSFHHVWIDTCCIDKRNSVELSEAVNSMFALYENATVCYAYLQDVHSGSKRSFQRSRWFTRGWTLQELLAPRFVAFFDRHWNAMGTKVSLARDIALVTGISEADQLDFQNCNIATKMSWAAKRNTTLLEDEAYCLLGLFNINMPLIYGEGRKAFTRLQEELIRVYDDDSIFAWEIDPLDIRNIGKTPRSNHSSLCFHELVSS